MFKLILITATLAAFAQSAPTYFQVVPQNAGAYTPVVYTSNFHHQAPLVSHTVPVAHSPVVTYTVPVASSNVVHTSAVAHTVPVVTGSNVVHNPVVYSTGAKVVQTYKPVEQHGYQISY